MKAAIYIRVSTDRQAEEGFSIEAQHELLMELLERKGLELYRVYSDPGISGRTIKKRPGVQRLIADMKAGRFDAVLIHKLDRFSRNLGDLYDFIALVNKLNKRLIVASLGSEEIDTQSPMGKAFLYFNGIFAEIYSDNLKEETLKGLTHKVSHGGRHMSRAPLGYDFDDDRNLIINEQEAKLIRDVYRYYLEGKGVVKIAKIMNGYSRGKEGGVWDSKYIRIVLKNPTYTGHNHFKPEAWEEERRIKVLGDHEPIISIEDFVNVQKIMARKANGTMSRNSYDYPYGGIIRCAQCGATYVGNATTQNGVQYRSYRCYNNYTNGTCDASGLSELKLNQLVFEHLLITGDRLKVKRADTDVKKDKKHLQKEIDLSNRRRKNWMMALGDGKLSPDDYAELITEEETRMKALYDEFDDSEDYYMNEFTEEEIKDLVFNLKENWTYIEVDTQKQLIQSMFRRIVIQKNKGIWTIIKLLTV